MGIIAPKKEASDRRIVGFLLLLIFLPLVLIYLAFYLVWGLILCTAIWLTWGRRDVLFVYSNSPTWKEYIERELLPSIQTRAVILNWSDRRNWKNSLAAWAFRYFGSDRNFNPMAVVFHPLRVPRIYRFYEAFKEFKHGDPRKIEELKKEFLCDLEK